MYSTTRPLMLMSHLNVGWNSIEMSQELILNRNYCICTKAVADLSSPTSHFPCDLMCKEFLFHHGPTDSKCAWSFDKMGSETHGFRVHLLNRSDTLSYVLLVLGSFVAASAWQAVALRGFVSRTFCDAAFRLEPANQVAKTWRHLKFSKRVTHLCIKAST